MRIHSQRIPLRSKSQPTSLMKESRRSKRHPRGIAPHRPAVRSRYRKLERPKAGNFPADVAADATKRALVASVGSVFLDFFSRPPLISFNRTAPYFFFDIVTLYACWYISLPQNSDSTPVTPPSRDSSPPTTILACHSSPVLAEVAVTSFERAPRADRLPTLDTAHPAAPRIRGGLRYAI
ncbi:hypothetical protein B0H17DRAFT_1211568 [Mycena rosella]|uniref:Uncharacterized protein n=1 Tax=Mycena rosella TaxID=1033263 RepID=A0AAD7CV16_MYCRO|nr:hypothetical protein B0H17DRAFT_1211568 [Mycena rosella]